VQVACGRNHSLAITTKNDVYACGSGKNGQLGLPDKEMRTSFTHVLSLMSVNAFKLYAGGFHSWVVLDDI
jgi:alpha-tubulin suppressor-like RCC1 family protein